MKHLFLLCSYLLTQILEMSAQQINNADFGSAWAISTDAFVSGISSIKMDSYFGNYFW